MPEAVVDQPAPGSETTVVPGNQGSNSPGWLAGLPSDLRDNEAFKAHKTVGDFAKSHLEVAAKAKEYEAKLANSIPKLGENATQEERDKFYNSLGRPEKPEGYELDPEKKNAPEWNKYWEETLFAEGIPKKTAQALQGKLNAQMAQMVRRSASVRESGLATNPLTFRR